MYKKFNRANIKRKLHEQEFVERQKTNRPKKGKRASHYKGNVVMRQCYICKITTPGSMLSLCIDDHAVCEFCRDKYFKDRENPQGFLKSAIEISTSQGIEIREVLHKMER